MAKTWTFGTAAVFILGFLALPDPDPDYLITRAAIEAMSESVPDGSLVSMLSDQVRSDDGVLPLNAFDVELASPQKERIHREVQAGLLALLDQELPDRDVQAIEVTSGDGPALTVRFQEDAVTVVYRASPNATEKERHRPLYRLSAVLPPLLAIVIAILLGRTLLALFLGVMVGAILMENGNPIAGLFRFGDKYLYQKVIADEMRVEIIAFVAALCAMIGVMSRGGGIHGLVQQLLKVANNRMRTQLVGYFSGLMIFFDDYANTILVGSTMRPLTDRMKISREKLAYIVDSTAAPIASLAVLSTWIAYEVSMFAPQLPEVGIHRDPYAVFVDTIPYRFYSLFTLLFVPMIILSGRDFGPMRRAEQRTFSTGAVLRKGARPMVSEQLTRIVPKEGTPLRWTNGFFPLLTVLVVTLSGLFLTSGQPLSSLVSVAGLQDILSNANSVRAIFAATTSGFLIAVALVWFGGILSLRECASAALASTKALVTAVAILILAWCIGEACREVGTAHYLIAAFRESLSPWLFPTLLFLLSCLVAFATGSSWSTMSILLPSTVLLAHAIGSDSPIGSTGLVILSIGAVLEGSIFGDHCSPLSDTTILSSVSSASDHLDHVRTQAPYALTTMLVAVTVGYLPAAHGYSPVSCLLVGAVVLGAIVWLVGRPLDQSPSP